MGLGPSSTFVNKKTFVQDSNQRTPASQVLWPRRHAGKLSLTAGPEFDIFLPTQVLFFQKMYNSP